MLKKYIFVLSVNLLLKSIFNFSPFDAHVLATRGSVDPSNAQDGNNFANYEHAEQHPGEMYNYMEMQDYCNNENVVNEKHDIDQHMELQNLDKCISSDQEQEDVEQNNEEMEKIEEQEIVEEAQGIEVDEDVEYLILQVRGNEVILQGRSSSLSELEYSLDSYRFLYEVLNIEFETTETYLNKIVNCSTEEEKRELLEDHIKILQEMYDNSKKGNNCGLPFELRDSMALRISDRLKDFCLGVPLIESYILTLKSAFQLELEVFKGVYYYTKSKKTYTERKEAINDLELMKFYHEELADNNGLYLTDEQLDNAAMRVSNFVNDIYFVCFSNQEASRVYSKFRDDNTTFFDL
ncbi:hypothetical protein PGO_041870 [Plasmodium gonderi]|uniref:Gamete antigen 27/25 n=1 Tax=Plasmodium gonderi TaxID=77519 RepID=A0A1Y1JE39_PLAGO|nr:hypothetical protein PGO_041870 [Plasmodium gonderi]GAW79585.1 hypothetical protein PGO_041870 [Plasmodium gonderi]